MLTGDNRDTGQITGRILLTGTGDREQILDPEIRDIIERADVIVYDASAGIGAFTGPVNGAAAEGGSNSSVHVIDGRLRPDRTCGIDFAALTETEGTLVFLPGSGSLAIISDGLISAGKDPDTPVMIIETGEAGPRRVIPSTLSGLKGSAKQAKALLPAVIVVGETCIPEGRPEEQTGGYEAPEIADAMKAAAADLRNSRYEWIVFTDESGVSLFMDALLDICDIRTLAYCRIMASGDGTGAELRKYGIKADLVNPETDIRSQGSQIAVNFRKGDRVLITGSRENCSSIEEELKTLRGVAYTALPTH